MEREEGEQGDPRARAPAQKALTAGCTQTLHLAGKGVLPATARTSSQCVYSLALQSDTAGPSAGETGAQTLTDLLQQLGACSARSTGQPPVCPAGLCARRTLEAEVWRPCRLRTLEGSLSGSADSQDSTTRSAHLPSPLFSHLRDILCSCRPPRS